MKEILLSLFGFILCVQSLTAQIATVRKPVYFIDSVKVSESKISSLSPDDIASISVFKDSTAVTLIGPEGRDGVIYVETKKFISGSYWKYFGSKSAEYYKAVRDNKSDSSVVYIINDEVLQPTD